MLFYFINTWGRFEVFRLLLNPLLLNQGFSTSASKFSWLSESSMTLKPLSGALQISTTGQCLRPVPGLITFFFYSRRFYRGTFPPAVAESSPQLTAMSPVPSALISCPPASGHVPCATSNHPSVMTAVWAFFNVGVGRWCHHLGP